MSIDHRIKLVFVITSLGTGGAQMMLYKMLTRLDRDRFEPTVITMIPGGMFAEKIVDLEVPVFDLGMKQGVPSVSSLLKLRKMLIQLEPQVVQGWMYHGNLLASLARKTFRGNVSVFWSVHQSLASIKAEKILLRAVIRLTALMSNSVQAVVFSAESGKQQHIAVGYCEDNAVAIRDNFDLDAFQPGSADHQVRRELGLSEKDILVTSVARYAPMKDHANLVSAARLLAEKFSSLHFILIGPGVDQNNATLTEQIAESALEANVHLLGERRDIQNILSGSDVFVLSSAFSESFPNVLGEAMACQVPCVTTDVGDSHAIVGDVGVVVPPRNPQALADGLRSIVELTSERRAEIGRLSRQRIVDCFNLDGPESFVRRYETLYEQTV